MRLYNILRLYLRLVQALLAPIIFLIVSACCIRYLATNASFILELTSKDFGVSSLAEFTMIFRILEH